MKKTISMVAMTSIRENWILRIIVPFKKARGDDPLYIRLGQDLPKESSQETCQSRQTPLKSLILLGRHFIAESITTDLGSFTTLDHHLASTGVPTKSSQAAERSPLPFTVSKNVRWISRVIGPTCPSPTGR